MAAVGIKGLIHTRLWCTVFQWTLLHWLPVRCHQYCSDVCWMGMLTDTDLYLPWTSSRRPRWLNCVIEKSAARAACMPSYTHRAHNPLSSYSEWHISTVRLYTCWKIRDRRQTKNSDNTPQTKHNPEKNKQCKTQLNKTTLVQLRFMTRKRGRLILQRSQAHTGHKILGDCDIIYAKDHWRAAA